MGRTKKLILIVEDSQDIRDGYADFLNQNGFHVALASDGQEALDQAFKLQPDLILMDLGLPVIGGRAATRQLKEHEKTGRIPIVILTAHTGAGTEAVIKEGLARALLLLARYGMDDKPTTVLPKISQEMLAEMVGPAAWRDT